MLKISELNKNTFKITVSGNTTTHHEVIITDDVHLELTNDLVSKGVLLEFSFKFLLDREPNTSILPSFKINFISQYFTEYSDEVRKWCNNE